jgi:eukaryotic-like serine/threonine-protein kinase
MIQAGDTIDGYRLEDVIGRGGMGTVYRAIDTGLDKEVALKIIAPHLAEDPTFLARFRSEAKALARLDAPGIVRVLALRETRRATFIAMEYVAGPPLRQVLQQAGRLEWPEAVSLLRQILSAVGHAHSSGVLHRDLKPSNILLTEDGRVKITDFGLAKIGTSEAEITATYETAGTVAYMSPEQVKGLKHVDERSDLFSVGLVAYEMLTGELPFSRSGSHYSIQRSIVQEPFDAPSVHNDQLPARVDTVVTRLLSKAPQDRYPTAREALKDLKPLDAPSRVPQPSSFHGSSGDSGSIKRSGPWVWAGVTAAALAVLTGIMVGVSSLLNPSTTTPAAVPDSSATLRVETTPAAQLFVNGDSVGRSPASLSVPPGSVQVRAEHPDYVSAETTLTASSAAAVRFDLQRRSEEPRLATRPAMGAIRIVSIPSDALVLSGADTLGTTTLSWAARPGTANITVEKEGYVPKTLRPRVTAGSTVSLGVQLRPKPSVVALNFFPYAEEVRLDGVLQASSQVVTWSDSLQPGEVYTVEAMYGSTRWIESVSLRPGGAYEKTVDFTDSVRVTIVAQDENNQNVPNAEILVDGSPVGFTPQDLDLNIGRHTITVRDNDYIQEQRVIDLDTDAAGRFVFTLKRPTSVTDSTTTTTTGTLQ